VELDLELEPIGRLTAMFYSCSSIFSPIFKKGSRKVGIVILTARVLFFDDCSWSLGGLSSFINIVAADNSGNSGSSSFPESILIVHNDLIAMRSTVMRNLINTWDGTGGVFK
jgi:hypothetical protein